MTLVRHPLAHIAMFGVATFLLRPCQAGDDSKPIVDVRFDAPYRQIESSMGDEWAPTWGRDDVLYTGNDDGSSFGGVPQNNITFGQLDGNDPDKLKGTSVNAMRDFSEPTQLGPEGANWNAIGSIAVGHSRYRLMPCSEEASFAGDTCLMVFEDESNTWKQVSASNAPVFRGGKFGAPTLVANRTDYDAKLGGRAREYAYAASYAGFIDGEDQYFVARIPTQKLPQARMADWSFQQKDYGFAPNLNTTAPMRNNTGLGPDGGNWKIMNSYSVDGVLYMFVTRCHYPAQSGDPTGRHIFENSSIIKSTDNGRTWSRSAAENYSQPMFPGKRFGTAYFVWYGKDGKASVDNADRYVYAISNDGLFENGDDYVLGRVLRSKLPALSAADWSFYKTGDGLRDGSWTPKLNEAGLILSHPGKASMTGMTYVEALHRYVMVLWHYHKDNFLQGIETHDLSTVLEFFEAPKPWGPWTPFKTLETGKLGWYAPIIGQRFQTRVDSTTVKAYFYATGFYTKPEGGLDMTLYRLNSIPITLSTKALRHQDPIFVGAH